MPGEIQTADLNYDGYNDLAVCILPSEASSGFGIYLYRPLTNTYAEELFLMDYRVDDFISVAIRQLNRDMPDVNFAGITKNGAVVTVYASDFRVDQEDYDFESNMFEYPSVLIMGHFNWDRWTDFAVISPSSDTLQILMFDGIRTFTRQIYLTDSYPTSLARIHFNDDNIDDLIVLHCNRTLSIFVGSNMSLFHHVYSIYMPFDSNEPNNECARSVIVADFNHDGKEDVAYIDSAMEKIRVLLSDDCQQ